MVEKKGVEPSTSAMRMLRSSQLSYSPIYVQLSSLQIYASREMKKDQGLERGRRTRRNHRISDTPETAMRKLLAQMLSVSTTPDRRCELFERR